jgi:hypothetical protein
MPHTFCKAHERTLVSTNSLVPGFMFDFDFTTVHHLLSITELARQGFLNSCEFIGPNKLEATIMLQRFACSKRDVGTAVAVKTREA